ncbi:PREDICTED: thrombin inhibitor rhodniin-like [Nicrophorus vespilloides]|uniref:Thrombin inhibitor rhodniin-like n=1 Tax=Nicrophorus vespilloides TaxID=110193 RepID=A0ABM1MDA4_NICVS|nr:PREDICTED: thrombin inhibitor rhodniin-like [Nicrophorus vespilloides]
MIFATLAAAVTAQHGICPLIYGPVCASNGITYGNECRFDYAVSQDDTITFLFYGTCEPSNWDEQVCGNPSRPGFSDKICGSDGVVYKNKCFFDLAVKRNPGLAKRHDGPCEE